MTYIVPKKVHREELVFTVSTSHEYIAVSSDGFYVLEAMECDEILMLTAPINGED